MKIREKRNSNFFHTFCSSNTLARSVKQSDSVSVSRNTGSVSTIVFDRSTEKNVGKFHLTVSWLMQEN